MGIHSFVTYEYADEHILYARLRNKPEGCLCRDIDLLKIRMSELQKSEGLLITDELRLLLQFFTDTGNVQKHQEQSCYMKKSGHAFSILMKFHLLISIGPSGNGSNIKAAVHIIICNRNQYIDEIISLDILHRINSRRNRVYEQ